MQVAKIQLEQMSALKRQMLSLSADTRATKASFPSQLVTNLPSAAQTAMSAISKTTEDDKAAAAAAAAVVAQLAACTSSFEMLNSVFSSFVAEKAASVSNGSNLSGLSAGSSMFPPEKRARLEKPMVASEAGNTSYFTSQQLSSIVPVTSMQPMSQAGHMQSPYVPAAAPPLPPGLPSSSPTNQFVQPGSLMSYGYGGTSRPPPLPLTSHVTMELARPAPPQLQQAFQTQMQQQNNSGGHYRLVSKGKTINQNHHPDSSNEILC